MSADGKLRECGLTRAHHAPDFIGHLFTNDRDKQDRCLHVVDEDFEPVPRPEPPPAPGPCGAESHANLTESAACQLELGHDGHHSADVGGGYIRTWTKQTPPAPGDEGMLLAEMAEALRREHDKWLDMCPGHVRGAEPCSVMALLARYDATSHGDARAGRTAAQERADVVTWLRRMADGHVTNGIRTADSKLIHGIASGVYRGDHVTSPRTATAKEGT